MTEEKSKFTIRKALHFILRFYREYMRQYKKGFLFIWAAHIFFAGVFIVPPFIIKQVIDEAIPSRNITLIWTFALSMLAVFTIIGLVDRIRNFWGHVLAQRVTYTLRNSLYSHLQKLSFSFYDSSKTGELLSRVIDDLNVVQEVAYHLPENLITSSFTVIFAGAMVFYLDWKLALASLAVIPLILIFDYYIAVKMFESSRDVRKSKALLASRAEDNISGIRIIQAFARESYEMERFNRENLEHCESRIRVIKYGTWLFPVSFIILSISLAIAVGYGGYRVMVGLTKIGTLTACIMYLQRFIWPLLSLAMISEPSSRFLASIERYFKYMDMLPDIKDSPDSVDLKKIKGDIQFKDVSFTYHEHHKEGILRNVNLHIRSGETVALVGPSGSGKTTITRLISRFYEPQKGTILLDGYDIKKIKLNCLRDNIGIVMQDDFLFSDTLEDNIAYGRLGAKEDEIIDAAKKANVHQFTKKLLDGYDTQLGERGVKVSEGQAQRISIARAILKDSPILILDEATSSVDSETELLIQQALERLMKGKTSIVIAHRLSTIVGADRILFIENGKIKEEGTHEELMQENGRYAHFYKLQFKMIRV